MNTKKHPKNVSPLRGDFNLKKAACNDLYSLDIQNSIDYAIQRAAGGKFCGVASSFVIYPLILMKNLV